MSISFILKTAQRLVQQRSTMSCVLPTIRSLGRIQPELTKNFHSVCNNRTKIGPSLLQALTSPLVNTVCGMKSKGKLNLRCRSCYFVWRKGRKYVMCKTHPRHKQQMIVKKERDTWILTHWTQGKRPWGKW